MKKSKALVRLDNLAYAVLDFIRGFKTENGGCSPTLAEIARGTYMSDYMAECRLQTLERFGLIERKHRGSSRPVVCLPGEKYTPPKMRFRYEYEENGEWFPANPDGKCETDRSMMWLKLSTGETRLVNWDVVIATGKLRNANRTAVE